jgi:hypothetical protein
MARGAGRRQELTTMNDSSIKVYFGGDTTQLQAAINSAHAMTGKFAKDSAAVFEEVGQAEKSLADFRKQADLQHGAGYRQEIILQREIIELKKVAASMEGTSTEKLNIQLTIEKKALELERMITKELGAQQALSRRGVPRKTGGAAGGEEETDGFIENANKKFSDLAKNAKKAGIDLGKGFGLGILINQFREWGMVAVENAQKTRDEMEKVGRPIDNATRSLAILGDGISSVKKAGVSAAGFLIGGYAQLGDVLGSVINRMRGISEAQENLRMKSQRDADELEAQAKKMRLENVDPERVRAANKAAAQEQKSFAVEIANETDRLRILKEKVAETENKINSGGAEGVKLAELHNELIKQQRDLRSETMKQAEEARAKELSDIANNGKLDLGLTDQMVTLLHTRDALERQLLAVGKDTVEGKKILLAIDANRVDIAKNQLEYESAGRVSTEQQLEVARILAKEDNLLSDNQRTAAVERARSLTLQHQNVKNITSEEHAQLNIFELQTAEKKNQREISEIMAKGVENLTKDEKRHIQYLYEENKAIDGQVSLQDQILGTKTKITAEDEKQVQLKEEQLQKDKALLENAQSGLALSGIRGEDLTSADDATLADILRRNNAQKANLQSNQGSAFEYGNSLDLRRLENENNRIKAEQKFRSGFRNALDTGGVEAARRMFQGNPLEFDRVLKQFTSGVDNSDKLLTTLEKTNNILTGKFANQ